MSSHRTRRAAALATSALLLLALPVLATTLTWPAPDLSALSWQVHLSSLRLPNGLGTAALIVALWGIWGLYLAVLGLEIAAHLRRRPVYLRGLRPLQLLAATTLGTITAPALAHAAPAPAATAPAAPESTEVEAPDAEEVPEEQGNVVERNRTVDDFGYDSAELTDGMTEDVAATAELIGKHGAPELPVVVTGHTDSAGDADYNLELSQHRAEAVAHALREHLDQDVVIETQAEGDRSLLEEADDAEQRRVEISYDVLIAPPEPEPETPPVHEEEPGQDEEAEQQQGSAVGLSLPGGLIVAMTAAGAGTLAGMGLERRRDATLTTDEETTAAETDDGRDDAEVGAAESEEHHQHGAGIDSSRGDGTPPAAPTGQDLALIDLAQVPGLGITGPGAHGAARTLLTRALDESDSALTVVVPRSTLAELLHTPWRLPNVAEHSPVMVTDTTEDALTLLQMQLLARHRIADDAGEDDETALAAGPQFVVLAPAEPDVAAEITTLLAHTPHAPLHAVLLGPWPDTDGPTLTLDEAGTITYAETPLQDVSGHTWHPTLAQPLHEALNTQTRPPETAEPDPAKDEGPSEAEGEDTPAGDADADRPGTSGDGPSSTPAPSSGNGDPPAGAVALTVLGERITLAACGHQVKPGRRAAYEVLAYLAVHHPDGTRLEAAIEHMWPETAPHRAVRRFHDAVSAARSACREHLEEHATLVIVHDEDRYRLNPDLVTCDLWRVRDLLSEAAQQRDATLASTAASMAGPGLVADADYLWAEEARAHLRSQVVDTITTCARHAEPDQAAGLLHQALDADPHSEKAKHALSRLQTGHARSGN
ncbi:OmpA family protein [Nocardiopsis sp. HNM0947]|uniref:OmpA family protein n=1 Tax=Nocardiopsis coralli TaxID=2772213 RepID=A0ABR9P009_9ACTN|nr:OmpA family protein [Nocardiopsis coralli]MBE2997174.1 OmpA family protein [Nocardiopsis coralli]